MVAEPFPLPTHLRTSGSRGDAAFVAWLAELPTRVRDVARRWGLRLEAPYEPGGSASWVAPARDRAGREAVLKVAWDHDEARDEAEGLAAFAGEGAVEVFAFEHDGPATVLLLERCRPGTPLRDRPEAEQHVVVAELLVRLRDVPLPARHPFRPLSAMTDGWATNSAVRHAARPGLLDPGLVRDGLALFRSLPRDADRSALLCTDLHAGNVLAGTRRPWLLVDPKPYVGDPHYDVLQHLLNCPGPLRRDPVGLLRHVADLAGLDAERVRRWLFARCVQESPLAPDLAEVARRTAP